MCEMPVMTEQDVGKKHICGQCACKFYDLKKLRPTCPKCGTRHTEPEKKCIKCDRTTDLHTIQLQPWLKLGPYCPKHYRHTLALKRDYDRRTQSNKALIDAYQIALGDDRGVAQIAAEDGWSVKKQETYRRDLCEKRIERSAHS